MNSKLKKTVIAAIMAALTAVVGRLIVIPLPGNGFLNIGDSFVCLSGLILGPVWGGAAAGIGALFTDLLAGYPIYAPATFAIMFAMGAVCGLIMKKADVLSHGKRILMTILGGALCELIMVGGYFVFEIFLYDFHTATLDIIGNLIQGGGSLVAFVLLAEVVKRLNLKAKLK